MRPLVLLTALGVALLPRTSTGQGFPNPPLPNPFDNGVGTSFETRNTGKSLESHPQVEKKKVTPRRVHYIVVSDPREWTRRDGRTVRASLVAHESGPVKGDSPPLTLLKDGRIRLLLEKRRQVATVELTTLSSADQAWVLERVR